MSLSNFIEKNYSYSIEKMKSAKMKIEKRQILNEIIGNLISSKVSFSIRKLSEILGVCRKLIKQVLSLFFSPQITPTPKTETRGRKKIEDKHPEIINQIQEICSNFENVDKSLRDRIVYVAITLSGIKEKLKQEYNYSDAECPCENTIRRILRNKLGYKITKVKKNKVFKKIEETDKIFENVFSKLEELQFSDEKTIGISIDDKVAKYVGKLSGGGSSWIEKEALDHDTNPDYIVKPFGIMDLKTNQVQVYCTTSNSTADFKVDCIEEYLQTKLIKNKNIKKLMIFLDNGPENSSRRKLWKYRVIELAGKYNIEIELIYYPPYHSKYNKIEHYWGVLQRHWSGLIIDDLDKLIGAINSCTWNKIPSIGILKTEEYKKGKIIDENLLTDLEKSHIAYPNKTIKKWSLIFTP